MNVKQLISLDWKSFRRTGSLLQTILMGVGKVYFGICYFFVCIAMSFAVFEVEESIPAAENFFKYAIYFWIGDLAIRYFFQKMPTAQIKPLLIQNIRKKTIVNYALLKTTFSFFNFTNLIIGTIVFMQLINNGNESLLSAVFAISFTLLLLANCYLVQLINHINKIALPFLVAFVGLLVLDYFNYFEITQFTKLIFSFIYQQSWMLVVLLVYVVFLIYNCYHFYKNNLSLESSIIQKTQTYKYYDLEFLNRFGALATFLKLDLKLLTRNKRTRTVLYMSLAFLLYGLLILLFPSPVFNGDSMLVISALMVTGGFMMLFGQYVPSWDSSYYPLMMTQNIPYRKYLESKWLIMVIGTILSMILGSFYLYFGWKIYLTILAVGFYNIGWNCYLTLITGAFVRSKIDLTSNKNAFGDSKVFNVQTILLSLPVLIIPIILYVVLSWLFEFQYAMLILTLIGLIGIVIKKQMFDLIEKLYKKQKYVTIQAYK